ncbi:MAG TPA: alpha/beta hydrolase [Dongiaceae bacterium]|nr:alpha/beta hydrolase [Dongiaceae bacterium]
MISWTSRALNVRQSGEGSAVLVLVHGFGADQNVWAPYMEAFARHFRVVTYDLACAGSADSEFFDMRRHDTLDGYVADLLSILDGLEVSRCFFVGHSVSGMIGLLAAAKRPELIEKLIMIGSSACYLDLEGYQGGFTLEAIEQLLLCVARDYRAWVNEYAPLVVGRPAEDPATLNFASSLAAMRPDIALATARMILLSDYRDRLDGIAVPTAVFQSRADPAVPLAAARYLHDHIKDSVLEVLDATGHMPHMTSAALVMAALWRHLAPDRMPLMTAPSPEMDGSGAAAADWRP